MIPKVRSLLSVPLRFLFSASCSTRAAGYEPVWGEAARLRDGLLLGGFVRLPDHILLRRIVGRAEWVRGSRTLPLRPSVQFCGAETQN